MMPGVADPIGAGTFSSELSPEFSCDVAPSGARPAGLAAGGGNLSTGRVSHGKLGSSAVETPCICLARPALSHPRA